MEKWLEVYLSNYNETSEIAQSLKDSVKKTYKDMSYIAWATMERLTYMCDPDAKFEKVPTEDGSLIHTTKQVCRTEEKGEIIIVEKFAHFVKVKLTFLGKEFIEDMPIQDNSYESVKFIDSNTANKALQRALAKVASRGTGIGLKLYEAKDLQFEEAKSGEKLPKKSTATTEVKAPVKEAVKESPVKTEPVEKKAPKVEVADEDVAEIEAFIKFMQESNPAELNKALQQLNSLLLSRYGFTLKAEDVLGKTGDELAILRDNLKKIANLSKVQEALISKMKKEEK